MLLYVYMFALSFQTPWLLLTGGHHISDLPVYLSELSSASVLGRCYTNTLNTGSYIATYFLNSHNKLNYSQHNTKATLPDSVLHKTLLLLWVFVYAVSTPG